ncbi:uncharacterized protein METZ01_LOCUS379993, partial [marine metagenome]
MLLAIVALTTLTGLGSYLSFDGFRADSRMRLFILLSAIVATPIGLLFAPRDRRQAPIYFISLLGGLAGLATLLILFTHELRLRIRNYDVIRSFLAVAIVALLVFACIEALRRSKGVRGWRGVVRQLALWGAAGYGLFMLVVGLNRPEYRPGWLDSYQSKLLATTLAVALVVFLASGVTVSVVRIQDEFRLSEWAEELRWRVGEIREGKKRAQILSGLYNHWLGTAAVLLRLIRWPYGKREAGLTTDSESSAVPNGEASTGTLLKHQETRLTLTDNGRRRFANRAQPSLSPKGWLSGH